MQSESIFFRYTQALAREVNNFYSYLGKLISWQDLAQCTGKKWLADKCWPPIFAPTIKQLEKFPKCIWKAPYTGEYAYLERGGILHITPTPLEWEGSYAYFRLRSLPLLRCKCTELAPPIPLWRTCVRFMTTFVSCFMMGKARKPQTSPKCKGGLDYPAFHPMPLIFGIPPP